jgi:hypothetical protein
VRRTHEFARARKQGPSRMGAVDNALGYLVTSFNSTTKETSDSLEMLLDWFYSFSKVVKHPDALLSRLLVGAGSVADDVFQAV